MSNSTITINKKLSRSMTFDRNHIDEEKQTAELSFSSEAPYLRWFGNEILDHSAEAVDLGRLRQGGALLMDHDHRDQIGVIESVEITADKKGRAIVRFGNSQRAQEIWQDVKDGIRTNISVGYSVDDMKLEREIDGEPDEYRVTRWTPLEVSIVSVPADFTVGVGRSQEIETKTFNFKKPKQEKNIMSDINVSDVRASAETEQRNKIDAIMKTAEKHNALDLARGVIAENGGVELLQARILDRKTANDAPLAAPKTADIGLTEKEKKSFSFVKALNALSNPNDLAAQKAAAFEIECSRAAAAQTGRSAQGIIIPSDILERDLTVGTATAGGNTVATNLLAGSFIDLLRNNMVMSQLGATMLTGLNGNVAIPRQSGGASAYWVSESGAPTKSQPAFDQVALSPKTLGAYSDISRQLLLQSSISVENFVQNELARTLALALDKACISGTGASGQPTGILTQSGINSVDFAGVNPTYAEVVAMETAAATDNADFGALSYIVNPAQRGALKTTDKFSSTGNPVWESGNNINGYSAASTNQLSAGDVLFGNFNDLIIGMWGGLDLTVDPYTNGTSGTLRVIALQSTDLAVRHPQSFVLGKKSA